MTYTVPGNLPEVLAHYSQLSLAGLLGLYLGGLLMAYDILLVVIVVHTLYEFLALMYLLRRHKAQHELGVGLRSSETNIQEKLH